MKKGAKTHWGRIGKVSSEYKWHYYYPACGNKGEIKRLTRIYEEVTCLNCKISLKGDYR